MAKQVVIIGAGQAGAALAAKLRALGFEGGVTMIGEEQSAPYQRPPLSKKYLLGELEEERLHLRPPEFYTEQKISLKTSVAAKAINREVKTVSLSDGTEIPYDFLALTTGARPRLLPPAIGGDLGGVFPVRTLGDVDAMAPEFSEGARVLIIGGGYIGLEAAAVAAQRGLSVTLIELAERILQRVAAPQTSDFFRTLHQSHGVTIRETVGLERLEGDGRVSRALLSTGETVDLDFASSASAFHRIRNWPKRRDLRLKMVSAWIRPGAHPIPPFSPPVIAPPSPLRGGAFGSKACKTPSTRPRLWRRRLRGPR